MTTGNQPPPTELDSAARPSRPRRLYLASLLLIGLAGITAFLGLIAAYASGISFSPLPILLGLAGPAAVMTLVDALLVPLQHRLALIATAVVALYGVVLGIATLASPFGAPLVVGHLAVAAIVFGVTDAFPPSPELPSTATRRLGWVAVVVVVSVLALTQLIADPLKPGDVRTPDWTGVVASAADRTLVDGRSFGDLSRHSTRGIQDGDLLLAAGTPQAPIWVVVYSPIDTEPICYQTRDMGYDDGDAVVIRTDLGSERIGLRVAKAAGFDPGGVRDGRYTGVLVVAPDGRLAALLREGEPIVAPPATAARAGFFCLDANGRVTRWDRGY